MRQSVFGLKAPPGRVWGLNFLTTAVFPWLLGAMALNRKFEMYHYRKVLVRVRQGDSDRDIDRSWSMGHRKVIVRPCQVGQILFFGMS